MQGCSGLHMQRPCCFRLPQRTHLVVAPVHVRSSRRWTPVQASSAPADSSGSAPGTSNSTQQPDGKDNRPLWQRLGLPKSLPFLRRSDSDDEQPHHDGQQWRFSTKTALLYLRTLLYAMIAMVGLTFVRYTAIVQARTAPKEVLYSDFVTLLDAGKVRAARLETSNSRLIFEITQDAAAARDATATASTSSSSSSQGLQLSATGRKHMKELTGQQQATAAAASQGAAVTAENAAAAATTTSSSSKRFYIKTAEKQDPFLVSRILQAGVEFAVVRASLASQLGNILVSALAIWLPLLPLWFFARRIIDARSGSGSKKLKRPVDMPRVTFADVAGVGAAKEELREVVACLKNAGQYSKVRARTPSGVLLCGPPGTGKTLLAKAVAGEAGVPFLSVSASEFVELFVGRGAARVRELFTEARKNAPCVVFIDELDAMGARRGMGYNDERDQTLIQLLTELDGFEGRQGVVLLAATNRPDVLDPALTRPGRLSRKVVVPLPDQAGRAAILGVHLKEVPLEGGTAAQDVAAAQLAAVTPNFSGAELANVVNEAALLAARRGSDTVGLQDLLEGVQRTRFGVNGGPNKQGGLQQRLSKWLLDGVAEQGKRPVKVSTA